MDVNIWAVIVAAVINMVVGYVWYSRMLFAPRWARETGRKMDEMGNGTPGYVLTTIGSLVQAVVLSKFVDYASATTVGAGLWVGFLAWLGFVAVTYATSYVFEARSRALYLINTGYFLVVLLINGALLAVWQ